MVGGWVGRGRCFVVGVCGRLELINAFTCRMLQAFATKTSHAASLKSPDKALSNSELI